MVKKKKTRTVKKKKKKTRTEDTEDWCFMCKDGGLLMVCDHGGCRKAYHPRCVDKDDSFLENGSEWTCSSHFCYLCHKVSKIKCFCCPKATCGKCFYDADFTIVKGNKGFCRHCLKLAFLIEDDASIDSDGEVVDFKDQDTYEFLFSEYYKSIKKEEGLNYKHVHSAHRFFKNGKSKCDLDPDEIGVEEDDTGDSEDVSSYMVSDCDDLSDTAGSKSGRTKKGLGKLKSTKGSGKDKKKEFIGWGSRPLIEFLEYIGQDTSNELSEHDVTSIIIEYCRENNLFDPKKKRKIHCDALLISLLRRKSVNKNRMQNLLAPHFAENCQEMDDISSSSEDRDYNEPSNLSRKRKSISCTESHNVNIVSEGHQSCFAAIVSSNLKLVYLKRSLVDELSKQPQTFDGKVLGSFVRIKTDPNDYLQKNSHLLVQVVGINRPLNNDETNKEVMLQLSNVPKNVPISKISDDDFSEEECQDLYHRMRNGLLKQPTVLELEQKARSLHEDIIKHWIPRKLVLLQNLIDRANEKGWRRELSEYLDQRLKLETQFEQSRLLNDMPKVIPEIVGTTLSPDGSPRRDKLEQGGLSELASGQTCNSVGQYSKHIGFAHCLNNRTYAAGPKSPVKENQEGTTFPVASTASQYKDTSQRNMPQSSTSKARNLCVTLDAEQRIKEKQSISVASVNDKQDTCTSAIPVEDKELSNPTAGVIVLSDDDEQENPDISIWHCIGSFGETGGPYTMSALKLWTETSPIPLEFKVWKTGQSATKAISVTDAVKRFFSRT
ncbi:uncharacterized protein At5g08430-like isoform X2 [Vigna unguiculata]|uniref:uncharacterized protein At5g08430-like isoform X2 n=1 Tax=Vigna unguiculata TaxID=3917 RepID=UPI00101690B3|nr:uncharacterized protein At5g08430-like isoform X2 [Vigna unguiculata]